jgi:hypothetical protein
MIDPSIWDDEDVNLLSYRAFKLYIALISNADDYGKLEASTRRLRAIAFRYDEGVTSGDVESMVAEIKQYIRGIVFYSADGKEYAKLLNWDRYQKVDHPKTSLIPEPLVQVPDDSGTSPVLVPSKGKESKGMEGKGSVSDAPSVPPSLVDAIASDPLTREYCKCLSITPEQIPKSDLQRCIEKYKQLIVTDGYRWMIATADHTEQAITWYLSERVKPPEHKPSLTHLFSCLKGKVDDTVAAQVAA